MRGQNIMKKQSVSALVFVATLAACTSTDPVYTQFYREAGSTVDNGSFGTATNNNIQVMNGERQYTVDLANRFATEITSMVTFAFNSSQLDANAQAILRQQADWIRQFPEIRFRVYGHTDAVGSAAYNRRLGLARANSVVRYLTSLGISRSRLEAVASFGETQPLIVTQGRERRNRRTVTEVSGFVARHPQVLDGKYAEIIYRDYIASAVPPSQLEGIRGSDLRTEQ
ncbi:OmpA family protein [Sulfitobacter pseudonitzschiae]|uniref:OmpA family protein n=2 Tax=Pseudosulfitobacter pseudonitzschiae TaxID=1402135 RepID=A0A9Q2P055_9RHOB|nr:OmpA family protein [Pseudosulfitobacter pseudonitzschiae]MBM2296401.1 OmpA family protein [Pseudosulfitobacter pseudonitzschiae]MBM2301314.1 OmpA family protein [Pseudosulfitobacter pseudonitzschiae]MBM2311098.1 OmpA family protein [Pseudosulfitobacter pseudonitzschiae]MBM2316011.1 OmpA family protein [Pseudosulfitobacter pseudonitzschiae]|tara:strand:+ start:1116 stop:1796 length:681 start_codon:yes stop_codon:yes gene_type:complete